MSSSDTPRPLTQAAVQILATLAEGDCHGYGVMVRIRERTHGAVDLRTGSFYRHLSRLLDDGLVAIVDRRRPSDDPRRGDYYRLSPKGRLELAAERRRLADLLATLRPRRERA